ncbi:MAG TPA: DUF5723 family protein [Saprospiraceae bacterium]|jgi:hypothetical protein|nr:DUF5723 family protein [Saprospiraceae bacterium]HMT70711.1 DUF5723 family protein [Saprospiraceae bacterium]HQV67496.1 DUF5723 family protein [Saprospiraceae bacterium]
MEKHLVFLMMIWMTCKVSTLYSQDISSLHLQGTMPGTLLNPAMPLNKKINISLGSFAVAGGTNGPSVNEMTSKNQDGKRYLDIDKLNANLDESHDIYATSNIRTIDAAVKIGSFVLMGGHGFRADANLRYTADLVNLASYGNAPYIGKTLELGPVADVMAYNELYLGAQKTSGRFTIGLKAKLLYGISNISTESSDVKFTTSDEYYQLQFKNNYILRSSGLLRYNGIDSITIDQSYISFDNLFYNNRGLAVDLGVAFQVNKNFLISASALDLGSIKWDFFPRKYSSIGTFSFEGVDLVDYIVDSTLSVKDTLLDLIKVKSEIETYSTTLNNTFTLGGRYTKDNWNFNLLYMMRNQYGIRNHALSVSVLRKIWVFDLGIQYRLAKNDYSAIGFYTKLNLGPFAAYIGADNVVGMFKPLDSKSASVRFGSLLQF